MPRSPRSPRSEAERSLLYLLVELTLMRFHTRETSERKALSRPTMCCHPYCLPEAAGFMDHQGCEGSDVYVDDDVDNGLEKKRAFPSGCLQTDQRHGGIIYKL